MTRKNTAIGKKMVQEQKAAAAAAAAGTQDATECSFGDYDDDVDASIRNHNCAENEIGVYVGFRVGLFGKACIVALFYWTGSVERAYVRKAAQEYCALLNNPPV